jgi:hypothetical protein
MSIDINPINDSESIRAYRHRILIFTQDLKEETDPKKRALAALYLAEAATTLARLETENSQ